MRRLLLAVIVLTTLLAGGCGIPDESDVTVVRDAPAGGVAVGDPGEAAVPNTRLSAGDPVQFVADYLEAAAGDPDGALGRIKAFMAPALAAGFQPGGGNNTDIKVVRKAGPIQRTFGNPEVTVQLQQIGTLNSLGVFTPTAESIAKPFSYKFKVDKLPGRDGLFVIDEQPRGLMMTDTALETFYDPRRIYWWDLDYTGLVPDLRYMPKSIPPVQQPTTVLNWLTNGPAGWLHDAVQPLRSGTAVSGNVPAISEDTLRVALSAQAVEPGNTKQLDQLRRQLQWSLRPLEPGTLELTIGRQEPVSFSSDGYQDSNPAYRVADVPERFVVYNGVIHRLADSPHAEDPVPLLKPEANKGVVSAAMSRSDTRTYAAVVATVGKTQRLRVVSGPTTQSADPKEGRADVKDVAELPGGLGRPIWASVPNGDPAGAVGLIIAAGRLYGFRATGGKAQQIGWQGDPGPVTAVSVAPDGHRVAVVSGGRLYCSVLNYGADGMTLSGAEELLPPNMSSVTAVAWSSEYYLAVAGKRQSDQRYALQDVSADGALALPNTSLADLGTEPVTHLTAYPVNPTRPSKIGHEMYEVPGQIWDVVGFEPDKITASHLAGGLPSGQPAVPTAPFFLG